MKKFLPVILLGIFLVVLTACGSGYKEDKNTQAVIDEVVKYETEVNNTFLKEGKKSYECTEKDFSFLIYKDVNRYIIATWVPYKAKTIRIEHFYEFTENKKLKMLVSEYEFNDKKASGNYELVYRSGKFKE